MADLDSRLLPADVPVSEALLHVLLNVSLTGIILFRPVLAANGTDVLDLAYERLNPAAQRLLHLPARPAESFLTLYPHAIATGVFAFYAQAWASGQAAQHQTNYQHDQLDGYFHLAAQRHGPLLVVSFTDTNDQPRTAVEQALRESQAREQQALAAAQAERHKLHALLTQAPVAIALFEGSELRVTATNAHMAAIWGRSLKEVVGQPLLAAVPELRGQGFDALLHQVLATRVPVTGVETPAQMQRDGHLQTTYYNFVYQPIYDAQGQVLGVVDVAVEVTEQVLARRRVQELNDELAVANEELQTNNEELLAANQALGQTQYDLQGLNQDLEARVAARTAETRAALHTAQTQREQLRTQQGLLSQILGQVPAAIAALAGPAHRYTFFNDQYHRIVAGRTALGRTVAEVVPEVVAQGFIGLLDRVYATGQPYVGSEVPVLLHDSATGRGRQRYMDLIYQPLFDGQQQPQGILAFIVDVTDKVLAQRQADTLQAAALAAVQRQSQERENLYQLFEQAPAAICLLREPDHRIEYLNPAYQALFAGRQLQGRTVAEVQPDAREFLACLNAVYATGTPYHGPEELLASAPAPGQPPQPHYFNFTYQAYREQGRIVGVSVFAFDVTDKVLARQQREAQQAELQRIFEQAPVAIAIMRGPTLVVELANAAVGRIWGRAPAHVLGRPYFEALPDTAGQGFEQGLAQVLHTGQPFSLTEAPVAFARAHTGQPTQAYVNFVFQPLINDNQHVSGIIAIGTEVTEQVQARQQVQALNQALQATNAALGDTNNRLLRTNTDLDTFVYTASHDLKAPITNIEGLLTALHEQLPPAALAAPLVPRILHLMRDSVARFQQTIGHLTDIGQLQQEAATAPAEAVAVATLVEAVRLDLAPLLLAAQATLTVESAPGLAVQCPPKTLRSVVYNLLSNAVKYCDPARPPVVALHCHAHAGQAVLAVHDNGLGLSEGQQAQLFRMFRRLHSHVEGSGVGLYMVKRLVENAGGTITVQSQPGQGSTFTVTLPLAR
ncbi:PAS domain-containing protein [Hymenobacter sp. H14-R3]|uniref:PAS domain-containing protein n=1 Tax=Hymenobacter sp. H14-R3 TaxID=3046308 RepID=UPI0024B8D0D0|nr:PAS domain-containing protein [Hymenobacter sp. H14-R3]MDJ0364484.1 PAS domain-containing protein [Hymenobacter sp. H14-R3]